MLDTCIVCDELRVEIAARRREEKELERLKVEEEMANDTTSRRTIPRHRARTKT